MKRINETDKPIIGKVLLLYKMWPQASHLRSGQKILAWVFSNNILIHLVLIAEVNGNELNQI